MEKIDKHLKLKSKGFFSICMQATQVAIQNNIK